MGLSASLFSGITGLQAHGEKMSVLGNNIANVNTLGFKSARMYFEDAISQDSPTAAGIAQIGRGVQISAVYGDFLQGSLQSTSESTDLAIGGDGFFTLKVKNEETTYYTRAGNFRFDKDGYLTDPHGYVLQGWQVQSTSTSAALSNETSTSATTGVQIVGVPTDIRLENFQSPPQATSRVDLVTNLNSQTTSKATSSSNPFFAMFENWDGSATTPLGATLYGYQSTMKIYDDNGSSHNLTTYFDQVTMSNAGGNRVWEYMVTVNPSEENRMTTGGTAINRTSAAGVVMVGTLSFNAAGELQGQSAFTLKSNASGDLKALSNWSLANFSQNGYAIFTANFLGSSNASFTDQTSATNVEVNFGVQNKDLTGSGVTKGWNTGLASASNASMIGTPISNVGRLPKFASTSRSALSTTDFSSASTTVYQSQDGYAPGFLQNISVDRDGVITGRYSNGQITELYALTLADFNNRWGLRRDGGNLFSETRESGAALTGLANQAGKGAIASNSLEMSNVDLSTEFVEMITTQRGFQANSKVITTTDTMLGELIALKR